MKKPLEVLKLYPEHNYTLSGAFTSRAARDPAREFILYNGKSWSWRAFGEAVEGVARLLVSRGVTRGDRVAVMARNCDGHVLMLLALARIGAIMVPVNPEFGVAETKYVLHHAEVCAVAATRDTLAVARAAADGLKTAPWFVALDEALTDAPLVTELAHKATHVLLPTPNADDTVLIVYTSGTTGFPKGAMHSQRSFLTGGEAFVQRVYLWLLERKQDGIGFIDAKPYVYQDVFTAIDPKTGRPSYNMDKRLMVGKPTTFCPSLWGGKDWPPAAYNPKTNLIYIPAHDNLCSFMVGEAKIAPYAAGKRYVGTVASKTRLFPREGAKYIGEVQAWDMNTGKKVWSYPYPNMDINWGPVMTTAGGLVFAGGSEDRKFRALDARSGKLLWEFVTNSGVTAMPASYMVDGVQYIAVQSGWGVDAQKMTARLNTSMKRNVQVPQGGVVWVFALK